MKIYTVDFEEILKNFVTYHNSLKLIQAEKEKFSDEIEKIKKEMETIVNGSKFLIDEQSKMDQAIRFKELQSRALKLESEFRNDIAVLQNKELENNFGAISEIVKEWADNSNIDLVINKTSVIHVSEKYDATSVILDKLKSKNLFKEFDESEFLIESE